MSGDKHSLRDWGDPYIEGAGPGRLLNTPSVQDDPMRPRSGTAVRENSRCFLPTESSAESPRSRRCVFRDSPGAP